MVHLDLQGQVEVLVLLDPLVLLDLQVQVAQQGQQVHRGHKEILDLLDPQVQAVPQVALVLQDQMVLADLLVPLAQQEALDLLALQGRQAQQERRYLMAVVTLLVPQVLMVISI